MVDTVRIFGHFQWIMSKEMVHALQDVATAAGKVHLGFDKDNIRMNLLCSSAAMSMYLGECPVYTIMMFRWWSSNAFLLYIRKQVEQFSHNITNKMLTLETYNHIPDYQPTISNLEPCLQNHANNVATLRNVGGDMGVHALFPDFALN